ERTSIVQLSYQEGRERQAAIASALASLTFCALPGLGRLTVRARDGRRHSRHEQIAAPAGIESAVHRTAGCARPLDGEVTLRSGLVELAFRGRRRARPGVVAVAVRLGTPPRARARPQGRREASARGAPAPSGEGGEVAAL